MPLAGDPDALLSAADELAGASRALGEVHAALTAHSHAITAGWTGLAAPAALARVEGDADSVRRAADALAGVVDPLRACAEELRTAQRAAALAEADTSSPDAPALMMSAAGRALAANEAAARALRTAADGLVPATAPPAGGTGHGDVLAEGGNLAASLGYAALQHPLSGLAVLGGSALAALGAAGVLGGTAVTATGVGSPVGVPLAGASLAAVTAGVGLAGAGTIDLTRHALGDDRVAPFRVDADVDGLSFDAPTEIHGMTEHGRQRAEGRDGGTGVSDEAMADAVAHPLTTPAPQDNDTYRYEGRDAVVSLNERGEVVTTWARTSNGWRNR